MPPTPHFAPGADSALLATELAPLLRRWTLTADGRGVERGFRFRTFKGTWDFMNLVAAESKKARHHPEWSNVYNHTFIRWTTHAPAGLSGKDLAMARFCDERAGEMGEEEDGRSAEGRELVGRVVAGMGDCCGGKG